MLDVWSSCSGYVWRVDAVSGKRDWRLLGSQHGVQGQAARQMQHCSHGICSSEIVTYTIFLYNIAQEYSVPTYTAGALSGTGCICNNVCSNSRCWLGNQ